MTPIRRTVDNKELGQLYSIDAAEDFKYKNGQNLLHYIVIITVALVYSAQKFIINKSVCIGHVVAN